MSAYYNENDPKAAAWLRALITDGLIADGDVDERSIEDVTPADIAGFRQCHWFAGIGGWSLALRLAGWPDDREVWTGSCPCQPFSSAGKGAGTTDERHLWPAFQWLIAQCRPSVVFGEQVASKAGRSWFDLVSTDLEGLGYACWAHDLCAACVGAPHIRQRLFWVADSGGEGLAQRVSHGRIQRGEVDAHERQAAERSGNIGGMEDSNSERREELGVQLLAGEPRSAVSEAARRSEVVRMGDSGSERRQQVSRGASSDEETNGRRQRSNHQFAGSGESCWSDVEWLACADGTRRPTQPGLFPLASGVSARVGRLRGYGNAIVAPLASEFIKSVMP